MNDPLNFLPQKNQKTKTLHKLQQFKRNPDGKKKLPESEEQFQLPST
jgi:hypothetical protein